MLPPRSCQCSWYFSSHDLIPVYVRYLQPLWRSCSLYIVRGDDHMWHMSIMPIHGHCTIMYPRLLHFIFTVTCWYVSLYCTNEWLVLPFGSSLLHFWDIYNVFRPSCYPYDLTHYRESVIVDFTTLGISYFYGLPCPYADSLTPFAQDILWCSKKSL